MALLAQIKRVKSVSRCEAVKTNALPKNSFKRTPSKEMEVGVFSRKDVTVLSSGMKGAQWGTALGKRGKQQGK